MDSWNPSLPADLRDRLEDWSDQVRQVERGCRGRARTIDDPLDEYAAITEDRGWIVARLEGRPDHGLRELFVDALQLPLADRARPSTSHRATAAAQAFRDFAGPVFDARVADRRSATKRGEADPQLERDLDELLLALVKAAVADGVGIAVLIERSSNLSTSDLSTIFSLARRIEARRWPLQVVLAGLHD